MHALRRELTGTLRNVATQLRDELEPGVYWTAALTLQKCYSHQKMPSGNHSSYDLLGTKVNPHGGNKMMLWSMILKKDLSKIKSLLF